MNPVKYSQFLFSVLGILFIIIRVFFMLQQRKEGNTNTRDNEHMVREGKWNYILRRRIILPLAILSGYFYFRYPDWMSILTIPMPHFVFILSAITGIAGLGLLTWVHIHLGKEWSAKLQIREGHVLITSGPYARIRHPMYTALFTFFLSLGVVSANIPLILLLLLAIISLALRIPKEEKMLTDEFGEEYRKYIKHTGRLFPKL